LIAYCLTSSVQYCRYIRDQNKFNDIYEIYKKNEGSDGSKGSKFTTEKVLGSDDKFSLLEQLQGAYSIYFDTYKRSL
jgi:hypothetical protein